MIFFVALFPRQNCEFFFYFITNNVRLSQELYNLLHQGQLFVSFGVPMQIERGDYSDEDKQSSEKKNETKKRRTQQKVTKCIK